MKLIFTENHHTTPIKELKTMVYLKPDLDDITKQLNSYREYFNYSLSCLVSLKNFQNKQIDKGSDSLRSLQPIITERERYEEINYLRSTYIYFLTVITINHYYYKINPDPSVSYEIGDLAHQHLINGLIVLNNHIDLLLDRGLLDLPSPLSSLPIFRRYIVENYYDQENFSMILENIAHYTNSFISNLEIQCYSI